ncbi:N-methyl-L-tryptophan oxidase [Cohnella candidum]|uniref:N-methyl-L-tryptophan oxidase n=1 Tax=Cohnella candidum TaxID=2674991 RepID=A0A3G3JUP2_9BACL|nr:N-methyl-L-tryptophan oxidase [Cohnella candidum]AYQ71229.1 N-methyl-L-tryptophan oxidase [Cohnella candidum]
MQKYDAIVVGAGAMGMSAGYHLAAAGRRVLLIDANDPPHDKGTHHGETRIIRHAYGEGREYTPLALRAQELWEQLEELTGRKLFLPTGFLQAGEPGSSMLEEMAASAREHGVPVERLDRAEIRRRWPDLALPESNEACFEPEGGVLLCEDCIRSYREAAEKMGAVVKANAPVTEIRPDADGATVLAGGEVYRADALVVTAGKYAGRVLQGLGVEAPLRPLRRTVAWFPTDRADYDQARFPAFLFEVPEGMFYGFPGIGGSGVKVGRHEGPERPSPLDGPMPAFGAYPEDRGDLEGFMGLYMPGIAPVASRGSACTYTMTPDEHFILDRHPEYAHVAIGAGFSGHGFKFASAVGEVLARMALKEEPGFDLSLFRISRFIG